MRVTSIVYFHRSIWITRTESGKCLHLIYILIFQGFMADFHMGSLSYLCCIYQLCSLKMEYILMLKSNVQAYKAAAAASGNKLKYNVKNRISGAGIFGVTCEGDCSSKVRTIWRIFILVRIDYRNTFKEDEVLGTNTSKIHQKTWLPMMLVTWVMTTF